MSSPNSSGAMYGGMLIALSPKLITATMRNGTKKTDDEPAIGQADREAAARSPAPDRRAHSGRIVAAAGAHFIQTG